MRKHGIENFEFGIIEECSIEELDEKERFYIKYYNSYLKGYNCDEGGQNSESKRGDQNGRTKLTNIEVLMIRNRVYINKEDM